MTSRDASHAHNKQPGGQKAALHASLHNRSLLILRNSTRRVGFFLSFFSSWFSRVLWLDVRTGGRRDRQYLGIGFLVILTVDKSG